ncbi:MAG: NUDIX domain-containing protein [Lachnospiraceae bacterium]|nr:NUDIX domain-containing protein [Lachnospiraceae bacterium]
MRNRASAVITRGTSILMERVCYHGNRFYLVPGGGMEAGETPEETALRELFEECGVRGEIIRPLNVVNRLGGATEYFFEVRIPEDATPIRGYDPEEPEDCQPIEEVGWKRLDELPEKDRAWLFSAGILEIESIRNEVQSWGDIISYPNPVF